MLQSKTFVILSRDTKDEAFQKEGAGFLPFSTSVNNNNNNNNNKNNNAYTEIGANVWQIGWIQQ
jgi:hypothetical protein